MLVCRFGGIGAGMMMENKAMSTIFPRRDISETPLDFHIYLRQPAQRQEQKKCERERENGSRAKVGRDNKHRNLSSIQCCLSMHYNISHSFDLSRVELRVLADIHLFC